MPAEKFEGNVTIVIDVLRATTTITTVLDNGALYLIPVEEVEEGLRISNEAKARGERCICGGERGGVKLEAYDCDNSPLQFGREVVEDAYVVLCTTNGTQAIARAMASSAIFIGCMNNATAVAEAALRTGRDIILLCAGTQGKFTCDDVVNAGAIASRIMDAAPDAQPDDLSTTAMYLYQSNKHRLKEFLEYTKPYHILTGLGLGHEIDYCLIEDSRHNVPVVREGHIENL